MSSTTTTFLPLDPLPSSSTTPKAIVISGNIIDALHQFLNVSASYYQTASQSLNVTEEEALRKRTLFVSFFNSNELSNIFLIVIAILIILLLIISIIACCCWIIFLLCWQRRRKLRDIERAPNTIVMQSPQPIMLPPPQNTVSQPSQTLNRQPELITNSTTPEKTQTLNAENPVKIDKAKKDDHKLVITIDAESRSVTPLPKRSPALPISPKASSEVEPSGVLTKSVQTDTSDEEELQDRVRGNETMPGRNRSTPRTELLV